MSDTAVTAEIEIKLRLADAAEGRSKLAAAGFVERHARCLERNALYDDAARNLRSRGELVRVRRYGGQVLLTYKRRGAERPGTIEGSLHKHRPEQETLVAEAGPLVAVLRAAGLEPVLHYEKYRTVYARESGEGLALLDETPVGVYLELEGAPEWIDRVAAELGYGARDYVTQSYLSLHDSECHRRGLPPGDMTFERLGAPEPGPLPEPGPRVPEPGSCVPRPGSRAPELGPLPEPGPRVPRPGSRVPDGGG